MCKEAGGGGGGGEGARDTESKTRTPHKVVGNKSRVICKVPRKKKSHDMGPLQLFGLHKYAKHVMSTNSHSVHFTSHMNKDSI